MNRDPRGFTLIEAILAIAMLTVSLLALVAAAGRCLGALHTIRNYHTATTVLDLGELDHPLIETNSVDENVVDGAEYLDGFRFFRTLEPAEGYEDLFVVRRRVMWSVRGRESYEEVCGYLYTTNHP